MQASPALLEATIHALDEAFVLAHPADAVLSRYFRDHPKLGQNDRAFIAETVFAALRRRRLLQHLTGTTDARALMLAALVLVRGHNLREMEQIASPVELEWLGELKRRAREPLPPEVEWDLPDWVIAKLRETYDDASLGALAKGLLRTAPLDLRVNLLKITREDALAALAAGGIGGEATPYSRSKRCSRTARSKCRTRAARFCAICSDPSAARWWWIFAPAPAARPSRSGC